LKGVINLKSRYYTERRTRSQTRLSRTRSSNTDVEKYKDFLYQFISNNIRIERINKSRPGVIIDRLKKKIEDDEIEFYGTKEDFLESLKVPGLPYKTQKNEGGKLMGRIRIRLDEYLLNGY
jgi:hypothetical protein